MKNKYIADVAAVLMLVFSIVSVGSAQQVFAQIASSTTSSPVSDATARIVGDPSLSLAYNSSFHEASLTASFKITINGGTTGVNIYKNSAAPISFADQKGSFYTLSSESTTFKALDKVDTVTDNYGQEAFVVPAGKSRDFRITSSVNPGQLFAGTYTGSIQLALEAVVGTNVSNAFKLPISISQGSKNSTNKVTIVGEVMPFITSVTNPVVAGQSLTITGLRLKGYSVFGSDAGKSKVFLDNAMITSSVDFAKDGTSAKFTVPASFAQGSGHTIYISNSVTGISNTASFQVAVSVATSTSGISIIAPTAGQNVSYGQKSLITWGGMWSGNDTFDVVEYSGTQANYLAHGVTQASAGCVGYGKGVCGISWVPDLISSKIQISVRDVLTGEFAYSDTFTVSSSTVVVVGSPVITVTSSPTLALTYDSSQKESALTATFNISVNGGAQGINIVKNSAGVQLLNQSGSNSNVNSIISTLSATSPSVTTTTDNYGQILYVVPAGQSVNFQVVSTASPRQLFAGTYHASLYAISANPGTNINSQYGLQASSNSTNLVAVVGELSPYISSVTNPATVGQTFTITGTHLTGGTVYLDGKVLSNVTIGGPTDGTSLSFTLPNTTSNLDSGAHTIMVINSVTGASNQITFQITGTVTTPLTPVISGGTFPTTLTVGQTGTWMVNASDPQNSALSYSVNWGDNPTPVCPVGFTCVTPAIASKVVSQSSTFTHSYSAAGNYTVTFTVTNSAGLTAQTSATVSVTGAVTPTTGSVTASLDASSPPNEIIPVPQSGVTFTVIDLQAGNNSVSNMKGIQIASDSTNAASLLQNIKVYAGSTLLGTASALTSNGSYYYQWVNVSGFVIPANTTVPLRLVADVSAPTSTSSVRLGIAGLNFDAPGANVTGLPIYGGTVSLIPPMSTVPAVALSSLSFSIANPPTTSTGIVNRTSFGGTFTVTAGGSPVFVAQNPIALNVITNPSSVTASVAVLTPSNGVQSYDGSSYYQVTPGSSRTFVVSGLLTNNANTSTLAGVGINQINVYSNSSLSQAIQISSNLQGLNSDLHIQTLLGPSTTIVEKVATPSVTTAVATPAVAASVVTAAAATVSAQTTAVTAPTTMATPTPTTTTTNKTKAKTKTLGASIYDAIANFLGIQTGE